MSNDKIDDLLMVGSAFDWITPTWAFIRDLFSGPVADFGIPSMAGWSSRDIRRLLRKNGIRVWGLMLNLEGDILMFTVPQTQAKSAYYVLQRGGVPLLYVPNEAVEAGVNKPVAAFDNGISFSNLIVIKTEPGLYKLLRWLSHKI